MRLLVFGDSTAVGAGVTDMADAVAGRLGARVPAAWRVVGDNGLRSDELLDRYLGAAAERPADLVVVLAGWNDALQLRSTRSFARATGALLDRLRAAHPGARIALVAPPRFGRFAVFPQPLRWALGVAPVRERCRDVVGALVRLACEIETRGGSSYPVGSRWRVVSTHRGRFALEQVDAEGHAVRAANGCPAHSQSAARRLRS